MVKNIPRYCVYMLIILPPSETKDHGGTGHALDFAQLSFPGLNETRREIAAELQSLSVDEAMKVLKLSEKLRGEAESNQGLFTTPTMPAVLRYTGVLFDALDAPTLPTWDRLAIGDALFGILRASDPIPHYRLSGGTKLNGRTMKSHWGKQITQALEEVDELIVDLRSGTYQQLGRVKDAVAVRVESVQEDGSRKVVSHFNKHYKGLLARELALSPADAYSAADVAAIARAAGMTVEEPRPGSCELTLLVRR